ncbi:hypothetical protein AFM11_13345 [Mycolicibacterium wolinskyi]|uniref:Uncharacterized protein n=2 Tax=Mycolicibacterium wolinskyi TaxID=59750 RepID=A0A132PN45_9MYCO|nr:hypothetical protein AFM11_13345 [Mycolicibacterium wolinskyi]
MKLLRFTAEPADYARTMSWNATSRSNGLRVLLIVFGVMLAAGVVLIATAFVVFEYALDRAFDSDDLGLHPIDETAAAAAMRDRGIAIPDGFDFIEMTELNQFVGADDYAGRFSIDVPFADAVKLLAEANPDFPKLRTAACTDEIVRADFLEAPGFTCGAGTELAVTTRTLDGVDVLADHYHGTPPDTETVLVVHNGGQAELFVLSRGQ